jgi:hypothetical protein
MVGREVFFFLSLPGPQGSQIVQDEIAAEPSRLLPIQPIIERINWERKDSLG